MSVQRIPNLSAPWIIGDPQLVLASDYDELRERVAWMMECDCIRKYIAFGTIPYNMQGMAEIMGMSRCARKAVEELLIAESKGVKLRCKHKEEV